MLQEMNLLADPANPARGNLPGSLNHSIDPLDIFENVMDFNMFTDAPMLSSDLPDIEVDSLKGDILFNPFEYNSSSTVSPTSSMSDFESMSSASGFISPTSTAADLDSSAFSGRDIDLEKVLSLKPMDKKVTKERCSSRASSINSTSTVGSSKEKKQALKKLNLTPYQPKQRKQALPDIHPSTISDPVEAKRAKNTEAARRSRARKMQRMGELEDRVSQLLQENEMLKQKLSQYEQL